MSFRLFVLTMLAATPIVVKSQSPVAQDEVWYLVNTWCGGNTNETQRIISNHGSIEDWDVSQTTDLSFLLFEKPTCNPDISKWNVSGVVEMHSMFNGAHAFNQPIGDWDVSRVEDMTVMFNEAHSFNQPIGDWDVSRVHDMNNMFDSAEVFDQPLAGWDVSRLTNMQDMFESALVFNQPIGNWDVSRVENMKDVFEDAEKFNQPIGGWNVSNAVTMKDMFREADSFNQPIGNWDVSRVTDMHDMFRDTKVFNQPIGNWDVSRVADMDEMFKDAKVFNQPIGNWDLGSVTDMRGMFMGAKVFNQPIGNWDVSLVQDMKDMFHNASSFDQFIGNWNVSSVTMIDDMFASTTYDRLLCWDSPSNEIVNTDLGLPCSYTEWDTCCDDTVLKESFRVTTCTSNVSTCVEPIPVCRAATRSLSELISNEVVTNEVSSERTGNLRSRALNGWFECGATHCPKERSTCETNEVTNERYCKCMDGYEEGIECRPTDECETLFPCPGGSLCVDMFPPIKYKCVCNSGYTTVLPNPTSFDEPGVPIEYRPIQCLDQDECGGTVSPCHTNATCTNTIGGHECKCDRGLLGNGFTSCEKPAPVVTVTEQPPSGDCITSDDCTGANMECANSECVCFAGYAQVGPNCQNEVHCDKGGFNNDCHRRATCIEKDGFPGFACKCITGWEDAFEGANGKSCMKIPPPATEAPPEPITDAPEAEGVGPHPNRPTVFCSNNGATCDGNGACCSGYCS